MAYISQINFGDGSGVKDLKDSNAVSTIASQGLSATQQENARNNIGTKLKSTTNATYDSNTITNVADRQYAVTPDQSGNLSVNVPWEGGGGSSAVTGVKGDDESTYRTGDVNITKANIGLGNVPNVTTDNQTPTFTAASTLATLTSGETLSTAFGKIAKAISDLISHIGNTSNPHSVTATQVGLGNVGNFKAVSTVANQGLSTTEQSNARANIGAGTGDGTVTRVDIGSTQYDPSSGIISLPAYPSVPTVNNSTITIQKNGTTVDSFTTNASSGKTVNITMTASDVGLGNVGNFKAVSTVANQGLTSTEQANARTNIGAGTGNGTVTSVKVGSTSYSPSSGVISLPSYPTVNDSTISIQKNGTALNSFTTNASSAKTINITMTKSDVGLGNVDNKSSATIRSEITSSNVTTALGYTPAHWTVLSLTKTVSTSTTTSYEFTNAAISSTSTIDVYTDVFGYMPSNISVSSTTCTVTMPVYSSAASVTVKIYVIND